MSWSKWDGARGIDADEYLHRVNQEDEFHARPKAESVVAERIARAIEAKRNEHWQRHLREHPHADATSCPGDYAAHDAYRDAAKIARGEGRP